MTMLYKTYPIIRRVAGFGLLGLGLSCLPAVAQERPLELSLEQSLKMLHEGNRSLQIAGKEVEMAESEHRRTSSFWYPMLNVTGAYVHMSNPVEVKQPLNQFTDPAKDFIHSVLPDDQLISSILDKIGSYSLRFPLAPQNVSTIDANLTWPIFAGGKRIYAGRITRSMVSIAEENRGQVDATVYRGVP